MRIKRGAGWGSHLPVLIEAVRNTTGPVVELGCGLYSTPFLDWACHEAGRGLTSYEKKSDWLNLFLPMASPNHSIVEVEDWDAVRFPRRCAVALVDHSPWKRRHEDALRLKHAGLVIVHDARRIRRRSASYGPLREGFRFRFRYGARTMPDTFVFSNKQDPREILPSLQLKESS